jgi:hypothetical protein
MCQKKSKTTLILKLTLGRDAINYELIPCRINDNYQPVPLQSKEKSETLGVVEKLSDFSSFCQDEYRAAIENSISEFRKEYARFLVKNWSRYPVKYLIVIFREFIFRKLGIER